MLSKGVHMLTGRIPLLRFIKKRKYSLKKYLVTVLIISTVIPLALIGSLSYFSINSLIKNRVENGVQNNLHQARMNLENILNNLEYTSMQLAFDGSIGSKLASFMETEDIYVKSVFQEQITDSISLVSYSNPNIGVIFYNFKEQSEVGFSNYTVRRDFAMQELPRYTQKKGFSLYGPHKSAYSTSEGKVFSIARSVDVFNNSECYLYIETNANIFSKLLDTHQYALPVSHILLNDQNQVVYSDLPGVLPIGLDMGAEVGKTGNRLSYNGYIVFLNTSSQDWTILAAVKKQDYNQAVSEWLGWFVLFALLSLSISFMIAKIVWDKVYKPIKNLRKDIALMSKSQFHSELKFTGAIEFDGLIDQFQDMRRKIAELLVEVESKERTKSQLEVEKLMQQINPHFLHNTLNSIQWMAKENGQQAIDRAIMTLTKVLHYNLGKEGKVVTVREELQALTNYIELQKMRYDFSFHVDTELNEKDLEIRVPRFILQPLVENALYHGLRCEEGHIDVSLCKTGDLLVISVKDDGQGMAEDELEKLFAVAHEKNRISGMGIGLNYVERMLRVYYNDKATFGVKSQLGIGTAFELVIPVQGLTGGNHDKSIDRG